MKLNGKNLSEACLNSEALNDLACNGLNENQINTKLIERMLTDATSTFTNHNSPKKVIFKLKKKISPVFTNFFF